MNGAWRGRGIVSPRSTTGFSARQVRFFAAEIYIKESEDWITVAACAIAEFGQLRGERGSIVAEVDCPEGLAHDSPRHRKLQTLPCLHTSKSCSTSACRASGSSGVTNEPADETVDSSIEFLRTHRSDRTRSSMKTPEHSTRSTMLSE